MRYNIILFKILSGSANRKAPGKPHRNPGALDLSLTKTLTMKLILFLLTVATIAGVALGLTAVHSINKYDSFDYHIDLQQDSIRVVDKYHDTIIHFDDLEEYLIKDNI
jgi:hypothetical protein